MKSLLDVNTCNEILDRLHTSIDKLEASWGKMNVSQMLNHCQLPLKIALKTEPIKSSFNPIMRLLDYIKKPLQKNLQWLK
mgnify:CR=1 FL=1